jgi:hypothetical protein
VRPPPSRYFSVMKIGTAMRIDASLGVFRQMPSDMRERGHSGRHLRATLRVGPLSLAAGPSRVSGQLRYSPMHDTSR